MSKELLEGNKLIAGFMGGIIEMVWKVNRVETFAWKGDIAHQWRKEKLGIKVGEAILVEHLRFHSSWDWLLPAVKKAKDYLQSIERPSKNHCCKGDLLEVDVRCALGDVDIEKTFKYLIPLIEWIMNHENKPTTNEQ